MKKISMVLIVVAIMTMMTTAALAAESTGIESLSIGGATTGENGQNVDITLNATNISGVGDLEVEILYNSSVISVNNVTNGTLDTGTIGSLTDDDNGSITIGGVGINGSGILATMNFTVVGVESDSTDISIIVKELVNNTSMPVDIEPVITDGTFTVIAHAPCEAGADCVPPVITVIGDESVTLTVGDAYTDAGATALDDVDGDITDKIVTDNPVDTNVADMYTVTYDVSDSAGNAAEQKTRIVNVIGTVPCEDGVTDCTPPTTTISGVEDGITYTGGVTITLTATDDGSGVDKTSYIVNGGPTATYSVPFVVDTNGSNEVAYWSTDIAGNVEPQNIINFIIGEIVPSPGNGKVTGKVFRDSNHNGILDPNEHGMKGVRVSIKGLDETNKDISLKVRSTTKGYEFANLPDGKYSVHVSHRSGFTHTSDTTVEVTVVNGDTATVDFGKRKSH